MATIDGLTPPVTPRPALWRRLAWLALIWICSVAALGVVAFALRLLMTAAGMKH